MWVKRLALSLVMFTATPAGYFALVYYYLGPVRPPDAIGPGLVWAGGIFLAVQALPAMYRVWAAIVIWRRWYPIAQPDGDSGRSKVWRLVRMGSLNYLEGALVEVALAALGWLFLLAYLPRLDP